MNAKRILRAPIRGRMWERGAPCTDNRFADICVAAQRAGCDPNQAHALAMLAFYAQHTNTEGLERASRWLFESTTALAAEKSPRSVWAYMRAKLGAGFRYVTDKDIRDTSMNDYSGWHAWATAQDTATMTDRMTMQS